ncbi:hypothetical protein GQ602_000794 [Ophiocordyceps camponoti-floridani]|uniref:Uncharacterized protein n=1 Tax=Ophiocordyceps camponoti-floridani TaxID=2030778 RepID=A0A8H4QCV7_9HYPO|nr:hypothetical protein GQ602_000794 [Ophiocordyceps camponoti-floridani]
MSGLYEPQKDLHVIAKAWKKASKHSLDRLQRIHKLEGPQLEEAVRDGRLVLETACLLVHASIKQGQYSPPSTFWHMLHIEYGIVVYPSAMTEAVDVEGIGKDVTFTDAYRGHVVMFERESPSAHPPPCPWEWMQELPPRYEETQTTVVKRE